MRKAEERWVHARELMAKEERRKKENASEQVFKRNHVGDDENQKAKSEEIDGDDKFLSAF